MGETAVANVSKARVNLCVLGWSAGESDLNEDVAEAVASYVRAGLLAGLGEDEIRADVAGRWSARFRDVSVEITRTLRSCCANVLAVAIPVSVPAPVPVGLAQQA